MAYMQIVFSDFSKLFGTMMWSTVIVESWRDVGVMDYPKIMRVDYQHIVAERFAGKCCATAKSKR